MNSEKKLLAARHAQTVLFLALLSLDLVCSGFFLKLVHFRALSGWDDEMAVDSLTFNWGAMNILLFLLNGTALTGVLFSFLVEGFYRLYGWAVALVFLLNVFYPWGLAFHYVRSFHFGLLFGMLFNGYGFVVLAFLKRKTGLAGNAPEVGDEYG